MKLYARRGFEWSEDGLVGLWSPVSTGGTQGMLLDCNPSTNNYGRLSNFTNINTGYVGSVYGTALNTDGTANRVEIDPSSVFTNMVDATISGWVFADAQVPQTPARFGFSTASFDDNRFSWITLNTGVHRFTCTGANGVKTNLDYSASVLTGSWKLVTLVAEKTTLSIFIDGRFATSASKSVGLSLSSCGFGIAGQYARAAGYNPSSQRTAEVTIHRRPLFEQEIFQAFQAGPSGMWQDRPRRSRIYFGTAGFKAYWAKRQSQLIGGGV